MKLSFDLDTRSIGKHLDDLVKTLQSELSKSATHIRDTIVKNVLNNNHWNEEARYSRGSPLAGQKYDLNFSGQLLGTIGSPSLNTINRSKKTPFEINIGDIKALDALKSQSSDSPSPVPYWRLVVFGHRAPHRKGPHTFYPVGSVGDKDFGYVAPSGKNMKGTPPTYMFSNGLFMSEKEINAELGKAISRASEEVSKRWR